MNFQNKFPLRPLRPLISIDHVTMVRDHRRILSDVNFKINAGDFIAVTGPNGGGKTTLLRIILGLLKPTRGSVDVLPGLTIGYLPQKNMIDSHFPISVTEVIASGLLASRGLTAEEREFRIADTIDLMGLKSHATRPIGELSGGQLQRALLGRAIISKPAFLVFDEPLSYIDKHFEAHLYKMIADLSRRTTILLVSHEMTQIAAMASRHLHVNTHVREIDA